MLYSTSRRGFLGGMASTLLARPFLRMLEGEALAQDSGQARRLLVFFSPNGTVPHRLWPTGTENDFSFASDSILSPLESIKDDLIVMKGLNFHNADNHEGGMSAMLTNNGGTGTETNNKSLDQYIASFIGGETIFPSLEFGVQTSAWGGNSQTRMCFSGSGQYVTPDDNPSNVYQRMFGDLLLSDAEAAKRRGRKQKAIDIARDELGDLYSRLGREEQMKMQAHMDSLNDMENRLLGGGICSPTTAPPTQSTYDNDSFPLIAAAQMDLAVTALACDLTRVATIQMSHTVGPTVFSWLGISEGHHSLSHIDDSNQSGIDNYVLAERWYAEQFLSIVEQLKNTANPEGDGTLFDDTLVVWAQELGDGRMHVCEDVPFIIAGNAGGHFETGRYLELGGQNHCHLLTSICEAFGLSNQTFGDPAAGVGGLVQL